MYQKKLDKLIDELGRLSRKIWQVRLNKEKVEILGLLHQIETLVVKIRQEVIGRN